jgi:hypothetical protein
VQSFWDTLAKLHISFVVPLMPKLQVVFIDEGVNASMEIYLLVLSAMPYVPGIAGITEVVSSLSQIMPELHDICGESAVVVTMELGSLDASAMSMMPSPPPSEPCQPSTFRQWVCVGS